jgi:hypothetical protein
MFAMVADARHSTLAQVAVKRLEMKPEADCQEKRRLYAARRLTERSNR